MQSPLQTSSSIPPEEIATRAAPLGLDIETYDETENELSEHTSQVVEIEVAKWFWQRDCQLNTSEGIVIRENSHLSEYLQAQADSMGLQRVAQSLTAIRFSAACSKNRTGEAVIIKEDGQNTMIHTQVAQIDMTGSVETEEVSSWQAETTQLTDQDQPLGEPLSHTDTDPIQPIGISIECDHCIDTRLERNRLIAGLVGGGAGIVLGNIPCSALGFAFAWLVGGATATVMPFAGGIVGAALTNTFWTACGVVTAILGGQAGLYINERYRTDQVLDYCLEQRECTEEEIDRVSDAIDTFSDLIVDNSTANSSTAN